MVTSRDRGGKSRKGKPQQRKRRPVTGSKVRRKAPPTGTRRKKKVNRPGPSAKDGKKDKKQPKKKDAKRGPLKPRTVKRKTPKLQSPSGARKRRPRKSTRPTKQTSRYQASSKTIGRSTNTSKLVLKSVGATKTKKIPGHNRKRKLWDQDGVDRATANEDSSASVNQSCSVKLSRVSLLDRRRSSELVRGSGASGPSTPRRDGFSSTQRRWSDLSDDSDSDSDDGKASRSFRPLSLFDTRRHKMTGRTGLADIDPMAIDQAVGFHSIGGLAGHISALKEMVVFPLLYPEVFDNFKIQPPRGCLFYGPPGTGKTLVARALANECSHGNRKVAFFMRKGADCLSKWVGESERQLRLLFEQAYLKRPSIIFFDEIDGLAPVRTSRQDHTHSSIVSTLLALMDGLDSRGEVVVIGATNRLDSIDPALRRPGRFDREFLFGLPDRESRKEILKIHTRQWKPPPSEDFLDELAEKCVGYCGADIRAVCTEAALCALRRRYPQIYGTSEKLLLDVSSISVSSCDFVAAMRKMSPASHRSVASPAKPLSPVVHPLLGAALQHILEVLQRQFPHAEQGLRRKEDPDLTSGILDDGLMCGGDESSATSSISAPSTSQSRNFLHFATSAVKQPTSYRPRMLLAGRPGSGQTSHLAPAVLHALERFTIHSLDSAVLFGVSSTSAEETCAQVFCEAKRTSPSILYIPHMQQWWETAGPALRASFLSLLGSIPSFSPILLLATCSVPYQEMDAEIQALFREEYGEVYTISVPTRQERTDFFQDLILNQAAEAPPSKNKSATQTTEVLPVAQMPPRRPPLEPDSLRLEEQEEDVLRELRLFLRNVTERLMLDRRFKAFSNPVDIQEVPDYLMVIKKPMDLSTLLTNISEHRYLTVRDFLSDADLIWQNALEYNPANDPTDRSIRQSACALRSVMRSIVRDELDKDFERLCEEIKESRIRRARKKKPRKSKWSNGVLNKPKKKKSPALASTSSSSMSSKASSVETGAVNGFGGTSSSSASESSDGEQNHPTVAVNGHHRRLNRRSSGALVNGHHHLKRPEVQLRGSVPKRRPNPRHQTAAPKSGRAPGLMLNGFALSHLERSRKGEKQPLGGKKRADVHDADASLLVVDRSKLKGLLSRAVAKTEDAEVDQLEKLYALLAQCIYRHRSNYDKTALIKEMRAEIDNFS